MGNYTLYVLDQENIEDDGFELNYDYVTVEEIREHSIEFYNSKSLNRIVRLQSQYLNADMHGGKYFYVVNNETSEII